MTGPRARRPGGTGVRTVRTALGVLWLLDGLLQLQPKLFGPTFAHGVIMPSAMGQPAVLGQTIDQMAHLISVQPALVDALFAGLQLLIGIGLLIQDTVKPALALSVGWALGVWVLGEGMGGLLTGSALPLTGAPGAALLYAMVSVLVWPTSKPPRIVGGPAGAPAARGPLGPWAGRWAWALYWTGSGVLWLLPSGRAPGTVSGAISAAGAGEPTWLARLEQGASHAVGSNGGSLAVLLGIVSVVVGTGPLLVRHYAPFLVVGAALALDYWVFGQAFGQMFTGIGTDPSTGPLVLLLALAISPAPPVRVQAPTTGTTGLRPVPDHDAARALVGSAG